MTRAEQIKAAGLGGAARIRCRACGNNWPRNGGRCNHCGGEEWWADDN